MSLQDHRFYFVGLTVTVALLWMSSCSSLSGPNNGAPGSDFDRGGNRVPSIGTLQSMVDILAIQGRDAECEIVLERMIADYPDHAPAYNELAELFMRNGRIDNALEALEAGLKFAQSDSVLNNNLGMCHSIEGRYDLAFESFRKAAEVNPSNSRVRANMAMALAMLGRVEESEALFAQLLSRHEVRDNMRILQAARAKTIGAGIPEQVVQEAPAGAPQAADPQVALSPDGDFDGTEAAEPASDPIVQIVDGAAAAPIEDSVLTEAADQPEVLEAAPESTTPAADVAESSAGATHDTEPVIDPFIDEGAVASSSSVEELTVDPVIEAIDDTSAVEGLPAYDPRLDPSTDSTSTSGVVEAMESALVSEAFNAAAPPTFGQPNAPEEPGPFEAAAASVEPESSNTVEPGTEPEASTDEESTTEARETLQSANMSERGSLRGLDAATLTDHGPLKVQVAPGVELRLAGSDRSKVLVSELTVGPIWILAPRLDVRAYPGSIVLFDAEGAIVSKFGDVREFALDSTTERVAVAHAR